MTQLRVQKGRKSNYAQRTTILAAIERGDIQTVIDKLTVRQRRFAEEYLIDFNASAAVKRAGYTTKYPNKWGSELMDHPGVKAAIDQITLERASKSVIKPDYVIGKITKTIERAEAEGNHAAVLRGCELIARHLGMFIERTEISGPNGDAIKYERVQEAADAFTSAISSLIERTGASEPTVLIERRDESRT